METAIIESIEQQNGGADGNSTHGATKKVLYIFPCVICGQKFQYPFQVGRHVENIHMRDSPSMCEICGKSFRTKHGLKKHERSHTGQKPYKCAICFKSFAQWSQWKAHEDTHSSGNDYQCSECKVYFKLKEECDEHCQSGICVQTTVECCGKMFSKEEFANHQIKKHRRNQLKRIIPCSLCDEAFENPKDATAHEKDVHDFVRPKPKTTTSNPSIREKALSRPKVECPNCKRIMNTSGLKNHLKCCQENGAGGNSLTCQYCNRSFKWKNLLVQHIRTHTGEKPLTCKYCQKGFAHPSSLYAHLRMHTGVKPFSCRYCELKFIRYGTWQSHERTHTGERPYECSHCQKRFAQRSTLTSHEKTHDPNRIGAVRKRKPTNNNNIERVEQAITANEQEVYFTTWDM